MPSVTVSLTAHTDTAYDILIGAGLLTQLQPLVKLLPQPRVVIVTNTTVAPLYLAMLEAELKRHHVTTLPVILPDGEAYKNSETLNGLLDVLLANHCERKTTLIALGGGVIGDMAGFAAAIYQRGMPFIQIPTTLLAQVDSSVGGKTAINHPRGKNMIGVFYQPNIVIADLNTLATLPTREFSAGLAEVIKYGLIDDIEFFVWLEANIDKLINHDMDALAFAVERCCRNKARIVAADEKEQGVRALLNLGHTFGHAIETALGYGVWLHGEAVAAGMLLAARASQLLGHLTTADVNRIETLLHRAQLPTAAPTLTLERWLALMAQDKKVDEGEIRFVLLRQIGEAYIDKLPHNVLVQVISTSN